MAGSPSEHIKWRQRTADLSWREIDDTVIVLDLRSASYLRLNASGAILWSRLASTATPEDLAQLLMQRCGLPSDEATRDVSAFLQSCSSQGILETV